jgi:hypothetical protein
MKFRYVVKTMVDASSLKEALKLAKETEPQEVFIDDRVFEKSGYAIREEPKNKTGF